MLDWLTRTTQRIPETYRQAINVAAVPVMRSRIRAALATLEIPLGWDGGNTGYCGEASAIIVMSIEMDAEIDADRRTEIDKINSVFFMLIICSHLSEIMNVSFEESSMIGSVEFVDDEDEMPEVFSRAMATFEALTLQNEFVRLIGNVVSCWIEDPTRKRYDLLVEMYKTTAKFVKS